MMAKSKETEAIIEKIYDYENDREIFPTSHNDGGICYFLWNSS